MYARPVARPIRGPARLPHLDRLSAPPPELAVVAGTNHAVAVPVHGCQAPGLPPPRAARAVEEGRVVCVHITVAIAVAVQPEERLDRVAARRAVAVAVHRLPRAVHDLVAVDGQRVAAIAHRL